MALCSSAKEEDLNLPNASVETDAVEGLDDYTRGPYAPFT
jgi:hypothetical protein